MLGAATLSVVAVPTKLLSDTRPAFDLEKSIPKAFGDWKVDPFMIPIPPSPDQESAMSKIYDQILSRTYVNSQGRAHDAVDHLWFAAEPADARAPAGGVLFGAGLQDQRSCSGLPLTVAGATVPSARMVATQGQRVEPVTYWFTMGDDAVMSYLDREVTQLKYALAGQIPDGYLVRVSSLSPDAAQAFAKQSEFADALMASLDGELRKRLTGGS